MGNEYTSFWLYKQGIFSYLLCQKIGKTIWQITFNIIKFAPRLLANSSAFVKFHSFFSECYYAKAESIIGISFAYPAQNI
jgi:hypothetical protein